MPLNLVQHRGGASVWDTAAPAAMNDMERWLAMMMAGGFLLAGLRRRSIPGLLLAAGGAAIAWWAAAAPEERRHRRGQLRAVWPPRQEQDMVAEASEESFPASDAPSWTSTTGNNPKPATPAPRREP